MQEINIYQQLLSEIFIQQLTQNLSQVGDGHCMRIEGLPYEVFDQIAASLQKNTHHAKVVLLSNKPEKKYEVSATKLIELRNNAENSHPLLVLIPSNLRTAAEDSFDRATFQQVEISQFPGLVVKRLISELPEKYKPHFSRIKEFIETTYDQIPFSVWAKYLIACQKNDYKEESWGTYLYHLGLIPDSILLLKTDFVEQRLHQNIKAVKSLKDEKQPLVSRINSLQVKSGTIQKPLFELLTEQTHAENVTLWGKLIAEKARWKHLDLSQWQFMDLKPPEELELFVNPLKGKQIIWNADDPLKKIIAKQSKHAKITVNFRTEPGPMQVNSLTHFQIDLMQTGDRGIVEKINTLLKFKKSPGKSDSRSKMVALNPAEITSGTYFFRVLALDATGVKLNRNDAFQEPALQKEWENRQKNKPDNANRDDLYGKLTCDSEDFIFEIEDKDSDFDDSDTNEVLGKRQKAASLFQAIFKIRQEYIKGKQINDLKNIKVEKAFWIDQGKSKGKECNLEVHFNDLRHHYVIPMANSLRNISHQILKAPEKLGTFRIDYTSSGSISTFDVHLRDNQLYESAPDEFLEARKTIFQLILNSVKDEGEKGIGIVESCDYVSISDSIEIYLAAYDQWMTELISKSKDSVDDTTLEDIKRIQLLDHVELVFPSSNRMKEYALLLTPLHPLKLAWLLQLQKLYLNLEEKSLSESSPDKLWTSEIKNLFLGELTPKNHPLVIYGHHLKSYYYAGDIAPGWSGYLPAASINSKHEGKNLNRAWFDQIQLLLGVPTTVRDLVGISYTSLFKQIKRYLNQHPYVDAFHMNVFNPGDGRKLVECLKLLQNDNQFSNLRYEIRLFANDERLKSLGTAFDDFLNPSRDVSEEADAFLVPSENALFPKIRFSRGNIDEYQQNPSAYPAHLSFMNEILPIDIRLEKNMNINQPSIFCYGLFVKPVSLVLESDNSVIGWSHSLNMNQTPSLTDDDSLTELLNNSLHKNQQLVSLALAGKWTEDYPALSLYLNDKYRTLLFQIHQHSDWVVTVDPNMGIDFYDMPGDGDYMPYLLDYSPGSHLEKIPIYITARPDSEIMGLFIPHLNKYNILKNKESAPIFKFLELLRSISGVIIMQSISTSQKAMETIGIGLSRMLIEKIGILKDHFIIPLDAHIELFENIPDNQLTSQRSDFLIISIDDSSDTIYMNIVEVKCRQFINDGEALNNLQMKITNQLENTVSCLQFHFDPSFKIPDRLDRSIKNKQLCELLSFYLHRANRYKLVSSEQFASNLKFLNNLTDQYKLHLNKIGLIFEFEGEQEEIIHTQKSEDLSFFHVGRKTILELFHTFTRDDDKKEEILTTTALTKDFDTLVSVITKHRKTHIKNEKVKQKGDIKEKPIKKGPTQPKKLTNKNVEKDKSDNRKKNENETKKNKEHTIKKDQKKISSDEIYPLPDYSYLIGDSEESPQYGILGMAPSNRMLALDLNGCNTISLFGVPGAGKSYSLGTIVEMAVKKIQGINHLPSPLASVIFHFHESEDYPPEFVSMHSKNTNTNEIEILQNIYKANPEAIKDILLLTPVDKIEERKRQYPEIQIAPISFSSMELSIKDWKFLMGAMGNQAMYIQHMNMIMRRGRNNLNLNYIRKAIDSSGLSETQKEYAHNRLELAEQFIDDHVNLRQYLQPGRIIIVDLRDEFIEKEQALGLFVVMLNIFSGAKTKDGSLFNKLIVFDEAHKYITHSDLTSHVVEVIRQMRHQGVNMLIASQDPPSLPNAIIELSSVIILHRFNSPSWLRHIQKSVVALHDLTSAQLASLQPGEAFIWANKATNTEWTQKAIKVLTRPRITMHGGSTQKAV